MKVQPIRSHYWPWQQCWISNQNKKQWFCREPSKEHSSHVWFQLTQWFRRSSIKCESLDNKRQTGSHLEFPTKIKTVTLHRTIQSSFIYSSGSISSVVSEKKIFLYISIWSCVKTMSCGGSHLGFPIHIKNRNLVKDIPMIIHLQFGFSQFSSFREEDLWNFSQSEHIIGPGSHVEYPTRTKNRNFVEDHPRNIPAKLGSNWPSGFGKEAWNVKSL